MGDKFTLDLALNGREVNRKDVTNFWICGTSRSLQMFFPGTTLMVLYYQTIFLVICPRAPYPLKASCAVLSAS
jgi:hypothetical protein